MAKKNKEEKIEWGLKHLYQKMEDMPGAVVPMGPEALEKYLQEQRQKYSTDALEIEVRKRAGMDDWPKIP
jgi:hypothetical protein